MWIAIWFALLGIGAIGTIVVLSWILSVDTPENALFDICRFLFLASMGIGFFGVIGWLIVKALEFF